MTKNYIANFSFSFILPFPTFSYSDGMNFRIFFLSFSLLFVSACSLAQKDWWAATGSTEPQKTYVASITSDERIELAKKRRSYITGIRKGDFYSLRNAPEEALSYYLEVQEKLPKDQVVRKKTANVYYILKNWTKSYGEYIKVPLSELSDMEIQQLLDALFFDETIFDRLGELQKFTLSTGSIDYYQTIDTCYSGIHNCIVWIASYSGWENRVIDLQDQIKKAEKISPDYQYRNLLVWAKLYEQWSYRATEKIAREILLERPDYMEVKKILGFSLFELGKYEEAKKYLLDYLWGNPRDLDSIVRLWEIFFHLWDYVSSNLYLNNAIIAGYTPKTNLERRLAYNYSMLDDTVGMMKVLNYLLQEKDATEDDFSVGISMAIKQAQYNRWESWAQDALEKFPNSHHITPLYIRLLRLSGQRDNASALIQNTSEEAMIENPNYLIEKAILYYEFWDTESAKKLFTELLNLVDWPDIVEESRVYLARMESEVTSR